MNTTNTIVSKTFSCSSFRRAVQHLIIRLRLYYALKPFAALFQKMHCLLRFVDWRESVKKDQALTGYTNRFELYATVINTEQLTHIDYLELGVSKGESMRWWLQHIPNNSSRFFGFDTFEGIPERWGEKEKGGYTNNGIVPQMNDGRCTFIKGLFQDTLHQFVKSTPLQNRLVVHFDADLYSATLFALFALGPILKPGDLLIFDEFDVTTHEFRAFMDYSNASGIRCSCIGESDNYNKVFLKVL